jgi:hypothetical protein
VLEQFKSWKEETYESKAWEFAGKLIEAVKKDGRFRGVHLMLPGREEQVGDLV